MSSNHELLIAATSDLKTKGYSLLTLSKFVQTDSTEALQIADSILRKLGKPIQVFNQYANWRPIGVRLDQHPNRSEGVGTSPLHMDFVNAENPPDLVALYCARSDPKRGGYTLLAPTDIGDAIPLDTRRNLERAVYRDGQVVNLLNIGEDINPFPVLCIESKWKFRYTGKLLESPLDQDAKAAVRQLAQLLDSRTFTLLLKPGDLLVIDQHRVVHGRSPLGNEQAEISEPKRRLLWQRFVRVG